MTVPRGLHTSHIKTSYVSVALQHSSGTGADMAVQLISQLSPMPSFCPGPHPDTVYLAVMPLRPPLTSLSFDDPDGAEGRRAGICRLSPAGTAWGLLMTGLGHGAGGRPQRGPSLCPVPVRAQPGLAWASAMPPGGAFPDWSLCCPREREPSQPTPEGCPLPGDGAATQRPGAPLQRLPLVPARVPAIDVRVGSWGPPRALGSNPATILLRPQEVASGGPCPSDSPSMASSAMFLSPSFLLALPGAAAHPRHSLAALFISCVLFYGVCSHTSEECTCGKWPALPTLTLFLNSTLFSHSALAGGPVERAACSEWGGKEA